jgi:hypothetical protein
LTKQAFHGLKTIIHEVNTELSSYSGNLLKIGAGDREMRGAQAMLIQNRAAAQTARDSGPTPHPRASLNYQLSLLQEQLAKAEVSGSATLQRSVLEREAALTREKIAKTKDLAKRTTLYQSLGSIEQQIATIDAKATADQQARRDKQKQARSAFLASLKKQQDDLAAHFAKVDAAFKAQQAAFKAKMAAAISSAFQAVGDLFTGPVLNPTDSATKGILGVTGGGTSIKTLIADLKGQNDAALRENRDLAKIAKRGGPASLIASLRSLGPGGAANVHAIATASGANFKSFIRQYERRQKVVQQIAHAEVTAKQVTIVTGNVKHQATASSQRRGRSAGVPSTIGSYIR